MVEHSPEILASEGNAVIPPLVTLTSVSHGLKSRERKARIILKLFTSNKFHYPTPTHSDIISAHGEKI